MYKIGRLTDILEHLEQGIALINQSFEIVFLNRKFKRLILKHFHTHDIPEMVLEHVRSLGNRKRAIIKLEPETAPQFFLTIKSFTVGNAVFYLLTLHKKKLRKVDLFTTLQSEYKVSVEQFKIITYLCKGFNNKEIARLCNIKPRTVKYHLSHLYKTFYVSNRTEFLNKIKEVENETF